jgi:hypothetical protein
MTYSSTVLAVVNLQSLLSFADATRPGVVDRTHLGRQLGRAGGPLHGGTVPTGGAGMGAE